MIQTIIFILGPFLLVISSLVIIGRKRWASETKLIRNHLQNGKRIQKSFTFDPIELRDLPAPVQRYFQTALQPGQRIICGVEINQSGTFNLSDEKEKWRPFTANQIVVMQKPGFDWNASILMFPALHARVHDAYVNGEGILHAAIGGFITVASFRGTPDAAHGEFMRFAAEAAWYPTSMLPSEGATWTSVDENSANLLMADGDTSVNLLVQFGRDNLIKMVRAEARGRFTGGKIVMAPWQCRLWDYKLCEGMRIPQKGEVEWIMPGGAKPYWRGRTTSIRYEFAKPR